MLQNYLKIALRNLLRNKLYSIINISGLALGVACCLILALYIQDELSYDQYHHQRDDLYLITTQFESDRGIDKLGSTSPPIGMTMKEEIPEVQAATRLLNPPGVAQNLIKHEDNIFYETNGFIADSTLFEVLTFEFIEGDPAKALTDANTVVICDRLAKKLFGDELALDQDIQIAQGGDPINFKITGVFRSTVKSHVQPNFIVSMMSSGWAEYLRSNAEATGEWAGQNFVPAYLKLHPGSDPQTVIRKMNEVLIKYGAEDMKALGMSKTLGLEPVKDIYLRSDIRQSPRITYLYVIASIAVFILLIACINFMNLSTAKASKRAGEIGIRKVMGAFRSSLISQLLGEAMVIVILAILVSVVLVQLGLPAFNQITGKTIALNTENIYFIASALLAITLITGIVAGSYPAFYLSSFQPAQVLKGKSGLQNASGWLRQSLVVFQFMIAITLVCGMIIVSQQLNYLQNKDLGFDSKAKIVLPLRTTEARTQFEILKREFEQTSEVNSVSAADYMPGSVIFSDAVYYKDGGSMDNAIIHRRNRIAPGYLEMLNIPLLAGRTFSDNQEMERRKVIVNATSVKQLGFTQDEIIGQSIHFDWQGEKYTYEVIGVMADYHQTSLKELINPTLFELASTNQQYSFLIADVSTAQLEQTLTTLEKIWKSQIQDTPFEYSFLDQNIQKLYDEDRKVGYIITSFTIIAMIICCLGLYGLSTYMAERRFKEIGVRKVMGASVSQIVGMMSQEFIRLVLVAFIISVPLAWYFMTEWLNGFAYHIPISLWVFVYAGLAAIVIALLTVIYESLKAASVNPVQSLRNE